MDIKFEKTGEARGVITVAVTESDYADKVNEKLKQIGKTHTIPGFRKGHITLPQLRQRFGREVKSEAINDTVINAVFDYIKEQDIRIIGYPLPADSAEIDMRQSDYTLSYDLALWPDLNLKIDKDVTLPFYTIAVSDEMVADQDTTLRERFGSQQPGEVADEKAVIKGSIMELNEDGTIKEGDDAIQAVSSILAPFLFKDKDEAAKFLGCKVGDKVRFNPCRAADGNVAELATMLNIDKEIAADVKADFEVAVAEIIVVKLAEHGQDFYDDVFGKDKIHSEEEYNNALRSMIAAQLAPNSFRLFNRDVHDYLMKTYADSMLLDHELLKKWMLRVNNDLTAESLEKDFDNMLPGIKWEIISSDVAQKLGAKATEELIESRAKDIARQELMRYGMTNVDDEMVTDMAHRLLADKDLHHRIENECEEFAMYDSVRNAVTIDNKEISLDDFRKLAEA